MLLPPLRIVAFVLLSLAGVDRSLGAIRVEIPESQGLAVITPEGAAQFAVTLINEGKSKESGRFTATLAPPSAGSKQTLEKAISLQPGERIQFPFSLVGKEFGVWNLACSFTPEKAGHTSKEQGTQDGTLHPDSLRFAYMEPAGPNKTHPEFRFGVVAHHERELDRPKRQREIFAAALIGCKLIRSNPQWEDVQPSSHEWRWELTDDMVDTFETLGMECQALLAYTPAWAARPGATGYKSRSTPDFAAWRNYVSTFVTRYKGRIPLWEPWNEPDISFWGGTTEEYIELATITLEEIRRIDPDAKVLTGGFATLSWYPGRQLNPTLQEQVMRTLGSRFDYHATHEHGSFDAFAKTVDSVYPAFRASLPQPAPPLFFNETGIHSAGGAGSENAQAVTVVKKSTFARSRGAAGYLWYDLRNDGTSPTNPEHNYGLITRNFEPKPAYVAFNTLARLAIPRPLLRQLNAGQDRWFFLHGKAPEEEEAHPSSLLVFWNDDLATQGEQFLVKMPGVSQASLVDINGNMSTLETREEAAVISADREPRYLLAEGARSIEIVSRLAGPSASYFGAPGQTVEVACEFVNPANHPLTVKTDWALPMAMQVVERAAPSLTIPPLGKMLSKVVVRLPEGSAYRFGQSGLLRVNYDYEGIPYKGRVVIPVQYNAITIPEVEATPERPPDIVLKEERQLHSFIAADPMMQDYRWTGPENLSARVWLGADAESLLLRVEVDDNRHHQRQEPSELWREDSVQCIIAIPGERGYWELGFADHETKGPMTMIWSQPQQSPNSPLPSGSHEGRAPNTPLAVNLNVEKRGSDGQGRVYTARIPRAGLNLTDTILRSGFRFNIAINDSDGLFRLHAMQLAPGIVVHKSIDNIPYIVFKKSPSQKSPIK